MILERNNLIYFNQTKKGATAPVGAVAVMAHIFDIDTRLTLVPVRADKWINDAVENPVRESMDCCHIAKEKCNDVAPGWP